MPRYAVRMLIENVALAIDGRLQLFGCFATRYVSARDEIGAGSAVEGMLRKELEVHALALAAGALDSTDEAKDQLRFKVDELAEVRWFAGRLRQIRGATWFPMNEDDAQPDGDDAGPGQNV